MYYHSEGCKHEQNELSNIVTVQTRRRETCHLMLIGDPGTGKV